MARGVPARAVSAHTVHDLTLVDIITLDPMLVQSKALVALAAVTADSVLAPSIQAHSRKLDALVDVLLVCETVSPRAQFIVRMCSWFRARLAPFAAPGTAHGTTAEAFGKLPLDRIRALPVAILHETSLLPRVYARGMRCI